MDFQKGIKKLPVGGMVRDMFMGVRPEDKDWLVVNQSEDSMIKLGWQRVGKSSTCPVFIHKADPMLEEYALPRTEVSTGDAYGDFIWNTENITVEQDLKRRDFTMNAMAYDFSEKEYIDPTGGRDDIRHKIIRHIDRQAFVEDPLRVIRACRFAARFGFDIAPETKKLCSNMVQWNMLTALPGERIYAELKKMFKTSKRPSVFFRLMNEIGALEVLFPELHKMIGVTQPEEHHKEGDVFEHTMMALDKCAEISTDMATYFAVLFHDVGKINTPVVELPMHRGHDSKDNVYLIKRIAKRLRMESYTQKCCEIAVKYHMKYHRVEEMTAGKIVKMFREMKVKHTNGQKALVFAWITVGICDEIGRLPGKTHKAARDYSLNWMILIDRFMSHRVELRQDRVFSTLAIKNMAVQQEVQCIKAAFKELPIRAQVVACSYIT